MVFKRKERKECFTNQLFLSSQRCFAVAKHSFHKFTIMKNKKGNCNLLLLHIFLIFLPKILGRFHRKDFEERSKVCQKVLFCLLPFLQCNRTANSFSRQILDWLFASIFCFLPQKFDCLKVFVYNFLQILSPRFLVLYSNSDRKIF